MHEIAAPEFPWKLIIGIAVGMILFAGISMFLMVKFVILPNARKGQKILEGRMQEHKARSEK